MHDYNVSYEASYPTPFATSTLLPLLLMSMGNQRHSPRTTDRIRESYDFIIVGAGSAGSVVASRLSELPCVTVLLLEAGKLPPKLTDVPGIGRSFVHSDIDWQYDTAPQRHTGAGLFNRSIDWPSGKTVGGSSVLNAMFYVRGNRQDYDNWARMGARGWSYQEVLPYFEKMEENVNPEYVRNGYHGNRGPVTVSRPRYTGELKISVYDTAYRAGYPIVDSNGPQQRGFYDFQATMRNGQRCSSAKAYLVPSDNRKNLDIVSEAFVRKVLIKNRQVRGVEFDFKGQTRRIWAAKEVIMSAGTVNTAQLLMLSGIGPKEELTKHNIPMVVNLPVGLNLQDHQAAIVNFEISEAIPTLNEKLTDKENIEEYINRKTGPLTSCEGMNNIAFLDKNGMFAPGDFPDYQLYFMEASLEIAKTQLNIKPDYYAQIYGPYENKTVYWCISQILHPNSRGTVTLRSSNPYDPPIIDPNYFNHPEDLDVVVEGMKKCMEIGTSVPLRRIGSRPFQTVFPGCEPYVWNIDNYFRCMAKSIVMTTNHQVGTAKMGDPRDPTTVVDPFLRVKYIKGLRVVDASVMPLVPGGNTNVPTMMIAEKASDIIKHNIRCWARRPKKILYTI